MTLHTPVCTAVDASVDARLTCGGGEWRHSGQRSVIGRLGRPIGIRHYSAIKCVLAADFMSMFHVFFVSGAASA